MSPAKAAQARGYNEAVKRSWSRAPVERKRTQREELLATPAMEHGLSKDQFKDFRSLGCEGSSAFTWQEAADFANKSSVGKLTVCDILGGSRDECVLGGKLTGLAGLIYDVFLADVPECATGQAEACAGVAASVVPGGGMGKLGKAAEEAARAAKAAKAGASWTRALPTTAEAADLIRGATPVGSALKSDALHRAASFAVDGVAQNGSVFRHVGGDGVERVLIQAPGEVNGVTGRLSGWSMVWAT